MRGAVRAIVIVLLLGALVGLAAYYDVAAEAETPYPDAEQLADDPDTYEGQNILVYGVVEHVEGTELTMLVDGSATITVRGVETPVEPGGVVQVYGPIAVECGETDSDSMAPAADVEEPGLESESIGTSREQTGATRTVQHADAVVVVNESRSDQAYKLVMSLFGLCLAVGLFLRHWRVDRTGFEVRDG